jgi:hypothetical protein
MASTSRIKATIRLLIEPSDKITSTRRKSQTDFYPATRNAQGNESLMIGKRGKKPNFPKPAPSKIALQPLHLNL